LNTSYNG